jgi:hypothetical protein
MAGSRVLARAPAVGLDPVAVATAVLLPDHVTGLGEIGDDAGGAALGDAQAGRDITQCGALVSCDAQQHPGVVGQEAPARHIRNFIMISRKILLVSDYMDRG